MITLWEYELDLPSNEVWNDSTKMISHLKEWVQSQRWAGLPSTFKYTITKKDEFILSSSDSNKILGFLLEFNSNQNQNSSFTYFIPIEIERGSKGNEKFPIILKCQDKNLFVRPAESNQQFFKILVDNLSKNYEIQSLNSNLVQFKRYLSKINRDLNIKSLVQLGSGNTTNTLFKIVWSDNSKWVVKIFRIFSRNPEVKMLKMLYQAGYNSIPQPYGSVSLKLGDNLYPLVLFLEFVEASGDGGVYFWNNINQQLNSWKPGYSLQSEPLNLYCQKLGRIISDFHYHSSNIKDEFFKPEIISQKDIASWKKKVENLFQIAYNNMTLEFSNKPELQTTLACANPIKNQILNKKNWDLLEGTFKIKIHQDLHLAQMLTIQSSDKITYKIIDFEGDPLLAIEEKFHKDPIFRDLASICSAFHYIKYNALQQHIETKSEPKIEKFTLHYVKSLQIPINSGIPLNTHIQQQTSFSKQWETFCQKVFLESYIQQLQERNLTFNIDLSNMDHFRDILLIFRFERFIKELYYESLFRKSNAIIPLIGILELGRKN